MTDQEKIAKTAQKMTEDLANEGRLVEGGWLAYQMLCLPADASEVQKAETRRAWFLGAQHVFSSIIRMLEPGSEPTERDLRRMGALDAELKKFVQEEYARPQRAKLSLS